MLNSKVANNEALLEQAMLRTLAEAWASCPAQTKITYKGPIKEFSIFGIVEFGFMDGDTVTEAKVNLFLTQHVISQLSGKGKNKGKEVGIQTIDTLYTDVWSAHEEDGAPRYSHCSTAIRRCTPADVLICTSNNGKRNQCLVMQNDLNI
jgi:hypothetical protein